MALVGIHTDAHWCIATSILNRTTNYRYSARLDHLIDSFKWMYELFRNQQVDLIINCGDLVDSDLLHAEVSSALSEALFYNTTSIPEYYILGNHEIKSKDSEISSTSILSGYPNIEVLSSIKELFIGGNRLVLAPFYADQDRYTELYDVLSKDEVIPTYVFTHASYIGESYGAGSYIATEGIDKVALQTRCNLKGIFNGHLHNVKDDGLYHQVGSIIGSSFGDSYSRGLPGVIVLDTSTGEFTRYVNPHAVIFEKYKVKSISNLKSKLSVRSEVEKCIRVECSSKLKEDVVKFLEQYGETYKILEYRVKVTPEAKEVREIQSFSTYSTPREALLNFINTQEELPHPKSEILDFLNKFVGD